MTTPNNRPAVRRARARAVPTNDSFFPKSVGNGFARHVIFGGLTSISLFATVIFLILALVGVVGWFWFGVAATATVVFTVFTLINFALTARALTKDW